MMPSDGGSGFEDCSPLEIVNRQSSIQKSFNALQARYTYGSGIDEPLTMERGGSVYYYHRDGLGSVTEISDAGGNLVERYEYDVYGRPQIFDNTDTPLSTSAIGNPYLFTGRRFDPESGNYYYRARVYSPTLGRFLQTDPLGYVDGLNLYAYVGNNPASWRDPYGLYAYEIDWRQILDTLVNTGKAALTAAEAALAGALADAAALVASPVVAAGGIALVYPVTAGDPIADENAYLLQPFVFPESNTCPLYPPYPGYSGVYPEPAIPGYPGIYPEPAIPGYPGIYPEPWVETIPGESVVPLAMNASDDELEEDDEFEDEYDSYTPRPSKKKQRRKPGKRGEFKGRDSLRRENKMAEDAAKKVGLNEDQAELLHQELYGQDLTYQQILEIARYIKMGMY